MSLGYRPLVYMWVAEFSDGSALPQFDPESGRENRGDPDWMPSKGKEFELPDEPLNPEKLVESLVGVQLIKAERPKIFQEKKLCRFSWYPFSAEMMGKALKGEGVVGLPTSNPPYTVDLEEGDKLVAHRENRVAQFKYRVCLKCGAQWQFGRGDKRAMVNLPVSDKAFVEQFLVRTSEGEHTVDFVSPICPECGYHDTNAVMMKDKQVKRRGAEVRKTFYVLGIEDGEIKRIGEDGQCVPMEPA